ncbi:MAG: hypothetical protein ABIP33_05120 [Pseudolysinimonas sp.]
MALFRRGPEKAHETLVAEFAQHAFAQHGRPAQIMQGVGLDDIDIMVGVSVYPLHNLILKTRGVTGKDLQREVSTHVESLLRAEREPKGDQLTPDALRQQIRTRILANSTDPLMTPAYSRPVAPGLSAALNVDFPETVSTVSDEMLPHLALPPDELYLLGQANVDRELVDERSTLDHGIRLLGGGSLFIASKFLNLPHLHETEFGAAPHGLVFALPHRSLALVKVLDHESVAAIQAMVNLTLNIASGQLGGTPGGLLSDGLYYWNGGVEIDQIGSRDRAGEYGIRGDGRFLDALNASA